MNSRRCSCFALLALSVLIGLALALQQSAHSSDKQPEDESANSDEVLIWDFGPLHNQLTGSLHQHSESIMSVSDARAVMLTSAEIRDKANEDAITAQCISLSIDHLSADKWLILSLDVNVEDNISTQIHLNGKNVTPDWTEFVQPSEPRTNIKKLVAYAPLFLGANTAHEVTICNEIYSVFLNQAKLLSAHSIKRLLHIMSLTEPDYALINNYFYSTGTQLNHQVNRSPSTASILDLMYEAEGLTQMMGWESATLSTGLSIFARYHQSVLIWDALLEIVPPDNAWHDRLRFERARLLHWLYLEQKGEPERLRSSRELASLCEKYPKNNRLCMYAGNNISNQTTANVHEDLNAPEWSRLQVAIIAELKDIAHWWADIRQADNGELGGKLGDDVELMRWWPILTLTGDQTTMSAWEKLSRTVWTSKKVKNGYSKYPIDVEHASEFISDTAPMMAYFSDSEWKKQLAYTKTHFPLWTAKDKDGDVFFRSAWFSYKEIDERPPRNRDLDMNARAMKPLRFLAATQLDQTAKQQVLAWADSWHKLAMSEDKGKPAGLFPGSYRVSDSTVNGDEPSWYRTNMMWRYFEWDVIPGVKLYGHMQSAYALSADPKYLEPMQKSLALIRQYEQLQNTERNKLGNIEGSPIWAAQVLAQKNSFWRYALHWRLMSGNTRYDQELNKYGDAYARYILTGNAGHFSKSLLCLLEGLSQNRPMQTEEVLFTDRLFLSPECHSNYRIVHAMLTGDISGGNNPFVQVSWPDVPYGFTALVGKSDERELYAKIFIHHQEASDDAIKTVSFRPWALAKGKYRLKVQDVHPTIKTGENQNRSFDYETQIDVDAPGQVFTVEVPPGRLLQLSLKAIE